MVVDQLSLLLEKLLGAHVLSVAVFPVFVSGAGLKVEEIGILLDSKGAADFQKSFVGTLLEVGDCLYSFGFFLGGNIFVFIFVVIFI